MPSTVDTVSTLQNQWNNVNLVDASSSSVNNILGDALNPCQNNNHLLQQQPHHLQQHQTHHNANLFNNLNGGVENLSPNVPMNPTRHFGNVPSQSFYNFGAYQSHLPSPPTSTMSNVMQQQMSALQPSMTSPAASMQAFIDSSATISATSKNHNNIDPTSMVSMQMQSGAAYPLYDMSMVPYPYLMQTGAGSQYTNQFYTG